MRDLDDIVATMRPGSFLSNGTMFEMWSARWCENCINDNEDTGEYCPILTALVLNEGTPTEIVDTECSEFKPIDTQ